MTQPSFKFFFFRILMIYCLIFPLGCKNESTESPLKKSDGMILIPRGILNMGGDNDQADPNEFPKHQVEVNAFWMDETEVTNAQFKKFVDATNYITIAERTVEWDEIKTTLPPGTLKPADSLLQAGALVFHELKEQVPLNNPALWWRWTIGANWKFPEGPESNLENKMDHPVVHIAWEDAMAFAKWMDKRLPTEAEWEWAARGGNKNMIYPWGNESILEGKPKANFWQGAFPYKNILSDGYLTTAPVQAYAPNAYGLYDMSGNVWEWCSDWLDMEFYKKKNASKSNTKGPSVGFNTYNPYQQEKVIRGGSFLCNDSYCSGYRNARRMGSSPDTGLNHTGFRCVKDLE